MHSFWRSRRRRGDVVVVGDHGGRVGEDGIFLRIGGTPTPNLIRLQQHLRTSQNSFLRLLPCCATSVLQISHPLAVLHVLLHDLACLVVSSRAMK